MTSVESTDTLSLATIFFVVIILAGGLVAYLGDFLGRKLGKARLTLFGIRPRHTAILITTATGLLIATSTIAILLAASYPLRRILVHGTTLMHDNGVLEKNNSYLGKRNDLLTRKQVDIKRQFDVNQAKTLEAERRLVVTQGKLRLAQSTERTLASKIAAQQNELNSYAARLRQEQAQLAVVLREKTEANKAARKAERDTQDAISKASKVMLSVYGNATYNAQAADLIQKKFDALRHTHPLFSAGEEVFRGVVKWSSDLEDIRRQISNILNEAGTVALKRGAKPAENGRAVRIDLDYQSASGKPRQTETSHISALRDQIFLSGLPCVVQVVCNANSLPEETVAVKLVPTLNVRAFDKGDVVACLNMDTSKDVQVLAAEFINFMAGEVRSAARGHNIIPRIKTGGEEVYIELDRARPASIIYQVKSMGGRVSVCAKAAEDTTAAGPLTLEFTVKAL